MKHETESSLVPSSSQFSISISLSSRLSGLAVKNGIHCGAGVVDRDFRGNVGVVLFNLGSDDFEVRVGDRIAQLIIEKISTAPVVCVSALPKTQRGNDGFGSTGTGSILSI